MNKKLIKIMTLLLVIMMTFAGCFSKDEGESMNPSDELLNDAMSSTAAGSVETTVPKGVGVGESDEEGISSDDSTEPTDGKQSANQNGTNNGNQSSTEETKPNGGNQSSTEETKPNGGNQGSTEETKPNGGNQSSTEETKPSGGNQGSTEETKPSGGNQGSTEETKPDGGNQGSTEETKPSGSNQGSTGETQPSGGDQGSTGATEPSTEPTTPPTAPTTPPATQPESGSSTSGVCTYEEYLNMSPAQQQAYYESFSSVEAYIAWYNSAKAEYDANKDSIEVEGGDLDIGDYMNGQGQ